MPLLKSDDGYLQKSHHQVLSALILMIQAYITFMLSMS